MSHNDLLRTSFGVFRGGIKVTSPVILTSDVTFNVASELSQPMGKTESVHIFSLGWLKTFRIYVRANRSQVHWL